MTSENYFSGITKFSCPSCGGKIDKMPSGNIFTCSYCGNQYAISSNGGNIKSLLGNGQNSIDLLASEYVIKRLQNEINELISQKAPYLSDWNTLSVAREQSQNNRRDTKHAVMGLSGGFVFFFIGVIVDWMWMGILAALLFVVSLIVLVKVGVSAGTAKINEKKYMRLANIVIPIENEINKKKLEIERHQLILSADNKDD